MADRARRDVRQTDVATRFALGSLATWRVVHLLAEEDGPGDIVVRARARLGSSVAGELMDCFSCISIWVAAPFSLAVARRRREVPLTWLALSGAACLLDRLGGNRDDATTALDVDSMLARDFSVTPT